MNTLSRQATVDKALELFSQGYACSQAVLLSFADRFNIDEKTAKLISSTFGGGMGRLRQKCGAVTGSFMVLGLAYGNEFPNDMETKLHAYEKVRELNEQLESIYGTTVCMDLLKTHTTPKDIIQRRHHKVICSKIVEEATGLLYDMLALDMVNNDKVLENSK